MKNPLNKDWSLLIAERLVTEAANEFHIASTRKIEGALSQAEIHKEYGEGLSKLAKALRDDVSHEL